MINLVAFVWAFLEATVFFIVPDVFLSLVGIKFPKKAFVACLVATLGALMGGALLFTLSSSQSEGIHHFFNLIPGISEGLQQKVASQVQSEGLWALLFGPTQGIPYKLYTYYSALSQLSFSEFLLISIPARLIRFMMVTLLFFGISRILLKFCSMQIVNAVAILAWCVFYTVYFIFI